MKRYVITIDDPVNCKNCILMHDSGTGCKYARRAFSGSMLIQIRNGDKARPGWCPLKELPEYKTYFDAERQQYEAGFDDCLDLIGGR